MSSSSSLSSRNEWKNALCFLPEAGGDPDVINVTFIKHGKLVKTLNETIDPHETILTLQEFKVLGKTPGFMAHVFLVLRTGNFWWSIEKDSKGITLQRGTDQDSVKLSCKSSPRKGKLLQTRTGSGRVTIGELVERLFQGDELSKGYHWWRSNCKKFCREMFEFAVGTGEMDNFTSM